MNQLIRGKGLGCELVDEWWWKKLKAKHPLKKFKKAKNKTLNINGPISQIRVITQLFMIKAVKSDFCLTTVYTDRHKQTSTKE